MIHMGTNKKAWMEIGLENALWCMEVKNLRDSWYHALPGFHKLIKNPAFFYKGNQILSTFSKTQHSTFTSLGNTFNIVEMLI